MATPARYSENPRTCPANQDRRSRAKRNPQQAEPGKQLRKLLRQCLRCRSARADLDSKVLHLKTQVLQPIAWHPRGPVKRAQSRRALPIHFVAEFDDLIACALHTIFKARQLTAGALHAPIKGRTFQRQKRAKRTDFLSHAMHPLRL
jgi:hypothetical protein